MVTHPDPEVEEVDARDEAVQDTYTSRRELMDIAVVAYFKCHRAIASRKGELKTAAIGVRPGPTNAQKAAMLVAKRGKVYANVKETKFCPGS